MTTVNAYWAPICELASRLRAWSRASVSDERDRFTTDWGQLLTLPVNGYLEGSDGPRPIGQFEWIQIAGARVRGGMAGRPLEFVDIFDEIVAGLNQQDRRYEIRSESWSMPGIFENEPVKVLHLPNPFRLTTSG